jgi:hypothetical protein
VKSIPDLQRLPTSEGITGIFYQSSNWFIHPQIIIATIERLSRISSGPLSLVDALGPTKSRRPTQAEEIYLHCEATAMRPRGRRLAGRSSHDRGTSSTGIRPDSTTQCVRAVPHGNDHWVEAAASASAHGIEVSAIGHRTRNRQQSAAEY